MWCNNKKPREGRGSLLARTDTDILALSLFLLALSDFFFLIHTSEYSKSQAKKQNTRAW